MTVRMLFGVAKAPAKITATTLGSGQHPGPAKCLRSHSLIFMGTLIGSAVGACVAAGAAAAGDVVNKQPPALAYGTLPGPVPFGYPLYPPEGGKPFLMVRQGDPGFAAVTYPLPFYAGGGHAFVDTSRSYPFITSYGSGTRYGYQASRSVHAASRGTHVVHLAPK